MKIVVVDDEPPARRRLVRMLGELAGDPELGAVTVVGEAADGVEARAVVEQCAPDLLLLDVQMPEVDGLALVRGGGMPHIVFTTAHAEHAVAAFELAAVDYLLKPIERDRLRRALLRAKARMIAGPVHDASALGELLRMARDAAAPPRLAARDGNRVHLLDVAAIDRLSARDKYVVVLHGGREYLLDDSLVALADRLAPHGFVRVHRAELVRLTAIVAIVGDGASALAQLRDGQRVPIARRELAALRRRLLG